MFKGIIRIFFHELYTLFSLDAIVSVFVMGSLMYFFYYPIPYDNEVVRDAPAVVVDLDNTTMSRQILRNLDATDRIEITAYVGSMSEAEHMMRNRDVYGIFYIPPGFEQNVLSGRPGGFSYYGDASYVIIYSRMTSAVQSVIQSMSQEIGAAKQIQMGVDPAVALSKSAPIVPVVVPLYNPQNGYATYVIPPVYVLIVYQCLFLGLVISMVLGRRSDFDKSLVQDAKASPLAVGFCALVGKWMAFYLVSIVIFFCFMGLTPIFYQLPFHGSLGHLALFGFVFLSATIFMSICIGLLFKKFDDIFLIILPSSMLVFFISGMSWPVEMIPWGLRIFDYIFPVFPAITSMITLNQMDGGFQNVIPELLLIIIQMGVYFLLAIYGLTRYFRKLQATVVRDTQVPDPNQDAEAAAKLIQAEGDVDFKLLK